MVRQRAKPLFPGSADEVARLVEAWRRFGAVRAWEALAPEVALGVVRRAGDGRVTAHALALLGHDGGEPGLAFFERRDDFDALWSGEPSALTGVSVQAASDLGERAAFAALNVEPFTVSCIEAMEPRSATARDVVFVTALLELVVRLHEGLVEPLSCGPGETVWLGQLDERPAP